MLKRLLFGLIKGLIVGGGIGAAFHFGLRWTSSTGLLAYLLAMLSGATAAVVCGKPPWRQSAWIESGLKAAAGLGFGALAYWGASTWLNVGVPFALPDIPAGTPWTEIPLLISTAIGTTFGTLIELDNTDGDDGETPKRKPKTNTKVRVASERVDAELVETADDASMSL